MVIVQFGRRILLKALTVTGLLVLAGPGHAAPVIVGGTTALDLTGAAALAGLGLDVGTLGTATLDLDGPTGVPRATFPITGGSTLADGSLLIQHNGSGLSLATATTTLALENFVIDTNNGKLLGNVAVNGSSAGIFELLDIGSDLAVTLSAQAGAAFTGAFGFPDLTGTPIGIAIVDPVLTPVPVAALLLAPALGLLGLAARRRRGSAAVG